LHWSFSLLVHTELSFYNHLFWWFCELVNSYTGGFIALVSEATSGFASRRGTNTKQMCGPQLLKQLPNISLSWHAALEHMLSCVWARPSDTLLKIRTQPK
jgi:hypothetical protein